jgi:hypothetical protein
MILKKNTLTMNSFVFQTDGGSVGGSRSLPRVNKYRAKSPEYHYNIWVTGTYFYTDDDKNDPFRTRPLQEQHYIMNYHALDWNMGGWNHSRVYPNTLQQYSGLNDTHGIEIYEGDIVRIYFGVSYDEDGTMTLSNEYRECVVNFADGSFRYGDEPVSEFEPRETFVIYVVGNVFDSLSHPLSVDYHIERLATQFAILESSVDAQIAFVDFAKEIAQIPLLHIFTCYTSKENELHVTFELNGSKFNIWKVLEDSKDTKTYRYGAQKIVDGSVIWRSDNFNEVINNIMENI